MSAQCGDEFVCANTRLSQRAGKRSDFHLAMNWNHASSRAAFHDHVTATLSGFDKAESFKGSYDFRTRNARQFRHELRWVP